MEPHLVIPIEPPPAIQWPRLVWLAALMTFIFALLGIAGVGWSFYSITHFPPRASAGHAASMERIRVRIIISIGCAGAVELFMAIAAFYFLKFGRGYRLVMVALSLWLLMWLINLGLALFLNRSVILDAISNFVLHGMTTAAFPVLALLILREYSLDQAES